MTDQPGIYQGTLPPSVKYGRCTLSLAYAAFDTADDADNLPEVRRPTSATLKLSPNLTGPIYADGIVLGVTATTLTMDDDGFFDFWAIDPKSEGVVPSEWVWRGQLIVDDVPWPKFDFSPDLTLEGPYDLGLAVVSGTTQTTPDQVTLADLIEQQRQKVWSAIEGQRAQSSWPKPLGDWVSDLEGRTVGIHTAPDADPLQGVALGGSDFTPYVRISSDSGNAYFGYATSPWLGSVSCAEVQMVAKANASATMTLLPDNPSIMAQPVSGRRINSLFQYAGHVVPGYGDYNANTGPVDLVGWKTASSTWATLSAAFSTEEVWAPRPGKTPGAPSLSQTRMIFCSVDLRGATPDAVAIVELSSGSPVVTKIKAHAEMIHVFDAWEASDGKVYACGSGYNGNPSDPANRVAGAMAWKYDGTAWQRIIFIPSADGTREGNGRFYNMDGWNAALDALVPSVVAGNGVFLYPPVGTDETDPKVRWISQDGLSVQEVSITMDALAPIYRRLQGSGYSSDGSQLVMSDIYADGSGGYLRVAYASVAPTGATPVVYGVSSTANSTLPLPVAYSDGTVALLDGVVIPEGSHTISSPPVPLGRVPSTVGQVTAVTTTFSETTTTHTDYLWFGTSTGKIGYFTRTKPR